MIFCSPELGEDTLRGLAEVERLQGLLASKLPARKRWADGLKRLTTVRAIQGSTSIEGYEARLDDVAAVVQGNDPLDADSETQTVLVGYRDAVAYVRHVAKDDVINIDERLIRSLHFVMMRQQFCKNPGRWRPGPTWVRREVDGKVLYEAPSEKLVPKLVAELLRTLESGAATPVVVQAAMAHLNVAMIHPFHEGNGRLARCLQTLVLAHQNVLAPEFASIEEYLGTNCKAYFAVLADVGGGAWHPERDADQWVRFCITAHHRQTWTLLQRAEESEKLWDACAALAARCGVPQRALTCMTDAARGFRVRNATYRSIVAELEGAEITEQTASRDLKLLADRGLLVVVGDGVGDGNGGHEPIYRAGRDLAAAWQRIRNLRPSHPSDNPSAKDFEPFD
ncbi:MAG: Fic family protein [Acidimicrobiales bacterium]